MNADEYKKYHEEHMMYNTGTSYEECCLLLSTIPFSAFLSSHLTPALPKSFIPASEFCLVILPIILNCTVLSGVHHVVFLNVLLMSILLIILRTNVRNLKSTLNTKLEDQKSFISNFRGSTNFVSALCILAVDFKVFPKRFIKTEAFGFGLMDLGVGFFICSNAFVEKHSRTHKQTSKSFKTELILLALGFIRVLSVKSVNYHEHVSEYGVHWNFFFTLAICRLLSWVLLHVTNNANPVILSVLLGVVHQLTLLMGLEQWVLIDKPRDSFVTANREGLVSCPGYISLYFASAAMGKYILHVKNVTYKKLLIRLLFVTIITWLGAAVCSETVDVSRRLVNIGYIFWVLALSSTELTLFVILEIFLSSARKNKPLSTLSPVPTVLESINAYGLFYFIISNLLTGLVNIIFQTLLMGTVESMVIIISYMIVLSSLTYIAFIKKLGFSYKNYICKNSGKKDD